MASGAIIIRHFVINSWPHQFTSQNDAIWIGIWLGAFIKVVTSTIPVMPIQKPFQPLFVYSPQCKEESPNSISNLRIFFSIAGQEVSSSLDSVLPIWSWTLYNNFEKHMLWILRCFKYFHIRCITTIFCN